MASTSIDITDATTSQPTVRSNLVLQDSASLSYNNWKKTKTTSNVIQQPIYREPLYMLYDDSHRARAEENIYEEVDFMTLSSLRAQYADTLSLQSWKKKGSKKTLSGTSSSSSFTRWFSTRKKNSPTLSNEEESAYMDVKLSKRQRPPLCLPYIPPSGLTQEQIKRRYIVGSIVDSENSYINSLHRLIDEFKKPMEEATPPILSQNKINIIFYRVEQILQCHTIFGIALSQCVREWDEKEKIGDVFINSFSKSMVLDIYSEFINNFTNAMETARKASKSKSAFAQFLQGKATSSPDRLSFFGLMVKPVQRFPQFILLLDDLLKHTPADHPDRMSLQLALTQLESLADRLNERKRDSERHFAVKQLLKDYLSNSTTTSSNRYLLRMDSVYVLDLDASTGLVLKTKCRKLYLLNDMLVCVSVPSNRLKFQASLQDVDVIDDVKPATDNLMANSVLRTKDSTPTSTSPQHCTIERMYCDLNNLMHDLEMMSRIKNLISSLRFEYNGLSLELVEQLSRQIHNEIRRKDNQITLIDRSCFQLRIRSKNFKDIICIQMSDPEAKKDWLTDVRLAKLSLDRANNPAWDIVSENISSSSGNINAITQQRVPLFVKSLPIFATTEGSQLTCALYYKLYQGLPGYDDTGSGVLWICNVNENGSQLGALATNDSEMALIHSYELCDSHVTCLELVASDLIWIGLKEGRVIIVDANSPGEWRQIAALETPGEVSCIKQFNQYVYVGLTSGVLTVYEIDRLEDPIVLSLSSSPVTCLLPIGKDVYACSATKIWVINGGNIEKSYSLVPENVGSSDSLDDLVVTKEEPRPNLLAHCGIGLWVSLMNSSIIKLYHTETFKHLQDLNVAPNVRRVLNEPISNDLPIHVTAMLATRGLLWIGTSVGIIVTLTLPRLQGVPLVSGCLNVALHRHIGPVTILLSLTPGVTLSPVTNPSGQRGGDKNQGNVTDSKTDDAESIYGLYADLMKVCDYDEVKKPSGQTNLSATRMTWDLSNMTISDDSTSESASSSAIYQDNHHRSHGSTSTIPAGAQGSGHTSPKDANNVTNKLLAVNPQQLQQFQHSQLTQQQQQLLAPQQHQQQHQQHQQQQQQQQQQTQMPLQPQQSQMPQQQQPQQQTDSHSTLSRMAANSLYDSKRSKPSTHGSEPNVATTSTSINHRSNNASIYGTNGSVNSMQSSSVNLKTALLMTGGNGYKRGLIDNPYSSQHAHCIIWEYKL
ncbi:rho guanine nucleotide exchange factor 10-like [Tetranychus urticae]|nr:rho guanine nucleotide exchange factor 10-like [Tetranychus urticae]